MRRLDLMVTRPAVSQDEECDGLADGAGVVIAELCVPGKRADQVLALPGVQRDRPRHQTSTQMDEEREQDGRFHAILQVNA
jgi:hypothetical protein